MTVKGKNAGARRPEFQYEAFDKPTWVGDKVTDNPCYFNSNLVAKPHHTW